MSSVDAKEIVKLLKKKRTTLAVAESITGGGIGAAITDISGSSEVFLGGVIAYSDDVKMEELKIPKALIKKHTAVSEEVAIAMAVAIREKFGSKYAIATTGVAGPGKAYGQKAGTVWVAIASVNNNYAISLSLAGDRTQVRKATIDSAFAMFSRILKA